MNQLPSPKGPFRFWGTAIIAAILSIVIASATGFNPTGWAMKLLLTVTEILIGTFALYYAGRNFMHRRTHELTPDQQTIRGHYTIIAIAIVIGCALL